LRFEIGFDFHGVRVGPKAKFSGRHNLCGGVSSSTYSFPRPLTFFLLFKNNIGHNFVTERRVEFLH
jgi:hypothetical protein